MDNSELISTKKVSAANIKYLNYQSEAQMPDIIQLIQKDLSEPYSIYTYRYFINNWGKLCFLAYDGTDCIGAIVCKLDARDTRDQEPRYTTIKNQPEDENTPQMSCKGYIAMLVVKKEYRKLKIGSELVIKAVKAMRDAKADEIVLETEVNNKASLKLYENLGFLRDKRLFRYYLNGLDALRLKLWIVDKPPATNLVHHNTVEGTDCISQKANHLASDGTRDVQIQQ